MCEYGDTTKVQVRVAADLSSTGRARWTFADIDRCVATIVEGLQMAGVDMRSSCCGHGNGPGEILLQDGRRLTIHSVPASDRLDASPHAQGVSAPLLSEATKPNEPTPGRPKRVPPMGAVGHPWQDFLTARLNAILWLVEECHHDDDALARVLSMDTMQATLCRMTAEENAR